VKSASSTWPDNVPTSSLAPSITLSCDLGTDLEDDDDEEEEEDEGKIGDETQHKC
jgi:hypothetical protein